MYEELETILYAQSEGEILPESVLESLLLKSRQIIRNFISFKGVPQHNIDDLTQEVFARIWHYRCQIRLHKVGQWLSLVYKISNRVLADHYRAMPASPITLSDQLDDLGLHQVDSMNFINEYLEIKRLVILADKIWLGKEPPNFKLRLLVANLHLEDGYSLSQIKSLLISSPTFPTNVTLSEMRTWLECKRTLGSLAYERMMIPKQELLSMVLGTKINSVADTIATLRQSRDRSFFQSRWTNLEAEVLCRRYGLSEPWNQTSLRINLEMNFNEYSKLVEKSQQYVPYEGIVAKFKEQLDKKSINQKVFCEEGIWKRIVLGQYERGTVFEDIVRWFGSVAQKEGVNLNQMKLHSWLSNRRLVRELERAQMKIEGGN